MVPLRSLPDLQFGGEGSDEVVPFVCAVGRGLESLLFAS